MVPERRIVSSCLSPPVRLGCFLIGKDGLRHRLRTPCNSEHSVFIGQYSNKWTTYHSATKLVSRHTSLTLHEEIGTTFKTGLVRDITRPVRTNNLFAQLAGKLLHSMDDYGVFHVQFDLLVAKGIDLHTIVPEMITVTNRK